MDKHKEIQKLAYELYERSGHVRGRDFENWLEAERIVRSREMSVHAKDLEAATAKKRVVERSDARWHEAKKTSKSKKAK